MSRALISPATTAATCCGDRGVDAVAVGEVEDRGAGLGTLGDLAGGGDDLLGGHPLAELLAEGAVARERRGAGGDEVAETGQPHQGQRVGAELHRQPGGLREAAGDQRRGGVVAEPEPDRHPDAQRHDVLVGAAELAAEHVGAAVGAERLRVAQVLQPLRHGLVRAGDHAGRRLAQGDLAGQVGPADDGDPLGTGAGDLGDHLAHPLGGAELDALHQGHEDGVARHHVGPLAEVLAQLLRRHRQHHELRARGRLGRVGRGPDRSAELDPREVLGVLVPLVDRRAHLGAASPDGDVVARVGEHQAERRTPRAGAEHRDLAHALPPLRLVRVADLGDPGALRVEAYGGGRLAAQVLDQSR